MQVCVSVSMSMRVQEPMQAKCITYPGTGVSVSCDLLSVRTGNQTEVL